MSIQLICRYTYILIISMMVVLCAAPAHAQQADTTATADTTNVPKQKKKETAGHQLCLGVDIFRPILNHYVSTSQGYEFEADYYLRNEFYFVGEGGWGNSNVDYTDLKYSTTNNFFRAGFNKCILTRDNPKDWDMMFMGLRVGMADVNRSASSFTVIDSVWGNTPGSSSGKNFLAYWFEVTGGMRVELAKGLFAGWNIRGKFLLNAKSFSDLSPLYIAGYGKGDKNTIFDFNLYISYGIRWNRKQKPEDVPKKVSSN